MAAYHQQRGMASAAGVSATEMAKEKRHERNQRQHQSGGISENRKKKSIINGVTAYHESEIRNRKESNYQHETMAYQRHHQRRQ